jgi:hypothetical protein
MILKMQKDKLYQAEHMRIEKEFILLIIKGYV